MADNQLVFFATSAGVTSKLSQPYIKADFPVIDLSGDLRLNDEAQYQRWYHKPSAPAQALNQAYYGLADFHSAHGQNYVANPGCYATATLLGLAPLVKLDLIDPDSIIVDAKSGTSGAGKSRRNQLISPRQMTTCKYTSPTNTSTFQKSCWNFNVGMGMLRRLNL